MRKTERILFCLLVFSFFPAAGWAQPDWQQQVLKHVRNGTVLAVDQKGDILFRHQADQAFIPASTLKVLTALAALKILGPDYRFKTDFLADASGNLYVRGYGDPFLISEEFPLIVAQLKAKGLQAVKDIVLDTGYFGPDVQIPGLAGSLNPYDAFNGALVANFNTIYIVKSASGEIQSAEPQTPVTEISKILAASAPLGKSRINVASHQKEAPLYVGYLLKEFLAKEGVPVSGNVAEGPVSAQAKPLLTYQNSRNLAQVLTAGLKYSQNLIMNQLFLTMGAEKLGPPAGLAKGKKVVDDFLKGEVGLQSYQMEEGSGISKKNAISAYEMDKVLVKFFPYYKLLPVKDGMWVKTGTLKGVSSLVGYFQSKSRGWVRFSIILNQPGNDRDSIAQLLFENLQ
jgi:D-alanyl-D-alanine carboxypeptidase/D-alanyl-D-alanine-endopeptidase (penicillin-binding protein 4)